MMVKFIHAAVADFAVFACDEAIWVTVEAETYFLVLVVESDQFVMTGPFIMVDDLISRIWALWYGSWDKEHYSWYHVERQDDQILNERIHAEEENNDLQADQQICTNLRFRNIPGKSIRGVLAIWEVWRPLVQLDKFNAFFFILILHPKIILNN